ncbi:hypothetical protein RB200_13280 [Streptomyces sp. PmtG]
MDYDYRMDLHAPRLARSALQAPSLAAYEPWVRVDLHDYRARQGTLVRGQVGVRLARLDEDLTRRRAGVGLLAATAWASPALRTAGTYGPPALFRAPLLVRDRDALVDRLVRHGMVCGYIYDPPLDDYAGAEFVEPSPDPAAARWFASHVLPADPLLAPQVTRALAREAANPARYGTGGGAPGHGDQGRDGERGRDRDRDRDQGRDRDRDNGRDHGRGCDHDRARHAPAP